MKKILSLILVVALSLVTFASCEVADEFSNDTGKGNDIKNEQVNDKNNTDQDDTNKDDNTDNSQTVLGESTSGLEFELNEDGKGYTAKGIGSCTESEILIDTYKGLPVTCIGVYAFQRCDQLIEVTLGAKVETIKAGAFASCHYMEQIVMPNSLKTIDQAAFVECDALVNITIPEGVTEIDDGVFNYCDKLESIYFPSTLTKIGFLFSHCDSFKSIEVSADSETFKSIDGVLFSKDGKTIIEYPKGREAASYEIPDTVTKIYPWAFSKCAALTEITIPSGVKLIETSAFSDSFELSLIKFKGTKAQWESIGKSVGWDDHMNYTVQCTDGSISKIWT